MKIDRVRFLSFTSGIATVITAACVGQDFPTGAAPASVADGGTDGANGGSGGNGGADGGSSGADGGNSSVDGGSSGADSGSSDSGVDSGVTKLPGKGVFVTSAKFPASFGELGEPLATVDAKCQLAGAARGGVWKAWLSNFAGEEPAARFSQSTQGYVRTDNVRVASSWSALVNGQLVAPIDHDETGAQIVGDTTVWTNTTTLGTSFAEGGSCSNWTSSLFDALIGDATKKDAEWTQVALLATCTTQRRLYCFEQ